jgi:hypothetical protein
MSLVPKTPRTTRAERHIAAIALMMGINAACSGTADVTIADSLPLRDAGPALDGPALPMADASTGLCDPATCPGEDNECSKRRCSDKRCATVFASSGTPLKAQLVGDCQTLVCDGQGKTLTRADNADAPDDNNACTVDRCNGTSVQYAPVPKGTSCGGTLKCDGAGKCVGCNTASDCPGVDSECSERTCLGNVCGTMLAPTGKILLSQTLGDCSKSVCDGMGSARAQVDDTDLPIDNQVCTRDVCASGLASNPPLAAGSNCVQTGNGGRLCNGAGACVQCLMVSDCPGVDTFCQVRTCVMNACGFANTPLGTVTPRQLSGDCKSNVCDGAGGVSSRTDSSDVPIDGNECTEDKCAGAQPSNPSLPLLTPCRQNGGLVCDGSGSCIRIPRP